MKKVFNFALIGTTVLFLASCGGGKKEAKQDQEQEEVAFEVVEPTIVVTEEKAYDVPVVPPATETKPEVAPVEKAKSTQKKETSKPAIKTKHTATEVKQNLASAGITPKTTIDTTYFGFSENVMNKTQSITSYEKKGEEYLRVISEPNDPETVDYIEFTDRKGNVDVYGVGTGMTSKEARELRKDLKHFEKKGKVFLYSEDSNILYELDGVTSEGKPVTEQDVDQMNISSIIWKDKNDKK